jgi:hypothetical protein
MSIEAKGGALVASEHGKEVQRITSGDLARLPPTMLNHIKVLEKSMENHYRIWERVYPELALLDSPVQRAQVELQLDDCIRRMKGDFDGILGFLEAAGLYLDDHYLHIRALVREFQ